MLAPGYKQIGDFEDMLEKELEAHADEYGLLGMSGWLAAGDRDVANDPMTLMYFKNVEYVVPVLHPLLIASVIAPHHPATNSRIGACTSSRMALPTGKLGTIGTVPSRTFRTLASGTRYLSRQLGIGKASM